MTLLLSSAPTDWIPRPAALATNRAVWAVTMADASMSPRFDAGERLYCDPTRAAPIGGYVVLVLNTQPSPDEHLALVGRVAALTDREISIESLNPPQRHTIALDTVQTIARVLTLAELLGG